MNWLLYLPPALSIYLLLISGFSSEYVKHKIHDYVATNPKLKNHESIIQDITLDWSARLSFFNSMFAAIVSVFSIWSKTRSYELAVGTFFILLAVFIPMMWWIMKHGPYELPATYFRRIPISHATLCRVILVVVNVILILAIAFSQRLGLA